MTKKQTTVPCPECGKQINPASIMAKMRVTKLSKAKRKAIAKHANAHRKVNKIKANSGK